MTPGSTLKFTGTVTFTVDGVTLAPQPVEWSIMAAAFAGFSLVITLFIKLFPVIATWEVAEHHDEELTKMTRLEAEAGEATT